MHRVVPELIIENYRAGRHRGEFLAIGLFLDLSGFSTMTDALMQHGQHGAEVLAGLMHGVFDPLVESIFDYGGKIVGFAGDGVMALFPVDGDARSTALRALTSASVIQQRFAATPTRQTMYGKFSVSAKLGLAIGSVSWGILCSGDCEQATYYFRGGAVDESAEAEHQAKAGDILLTESMCRLLDGDIETDPSGSHQRFREFCVETPGPTPVNFPAIDLDIARRFMPEEVIAHDVRGEFRQVVNLFMRFPDLSEQQLDELVTRIFELRQRYGGLLNRLDFGDKGCNMLMLWGAPVAYENDIRRALDFLLDLQAEVDFPITIGVTYYIAHAGYLGSTMCEDYTCYGWGVNLASRFMMTAPAGEIWVDDRIARRVSRRFDIEYIGSQLFKGFAAEQRVHRLLRRKQTTEPIYHGEMVGREAELARLASFTEPLWRGEFAGLLLVTGDAGIGKGRLVYEFRSSKVFEDQKILWAVCQSDQILRQSFNPLRSWLAGYFGFSHGQSIGERRRSFDLQLDDLLSSLSDVGLAGELDRTRSVLGALLDLRWENSLYEQLDAEGRYNNTLLALISLLKAESLRQPVVIFLEDLQFTDSDSRKFLPSLQRTILATGDSYPIAIIVTTRPSDVTLEDDLINARIDLRGLAREAVASFAETMLGGTVDPGLVSLLLNRSEGNPYFIEQIIRYLQEENFLETSRSGWALVRRVRSNFLPGDIRALLVARLDQLVREVKESVQTASVLGREFETRVLSRMLQEDDNIQKHIAEAEKAAIWTPLNEIRYIFSHGLLRDAAYEMQMRARRRELHALAVQALESLYPDSLATRWVELAYHAEYGELFEKAQKYFTLAGKSAADLYQNQQAIEYYTRALTHTPAQELDVRFSLLVEREELYNRIGDRASQWKDLESLDELAEQLDDPRLVAKADMLVAHYHISIGDYPGVLERSEHVVEMSRIVTDAEILLDTYRVWPLALLRQGKFEEAMRVARDGRRLAQWYADPVKEGYILNTMALIAIEQKDPAIAYGYLEQALLIARATGDRRLESGTLGNLGNSAGYIRKDYESAWEYYEADYAISHERGDRSAEGAALGNLGWAAGMLGDFQSARSYYQRALQLAREVGHIYLETYTLINLSANAGLTNEAQASLGYAAKALELSRKAGDRSGEAWSLLYMGYAFLLLTDLSKAEDSFRQAMIIREELGQPAMKIESLAGLIQTLFQKGEDSSALLETEKILLYLDEGGTLDGAEAPLRVYYACYLVLEKAGDPRTPTVLHSAVALLEVQLSKLRSEDSRRRYVENVPWRHAIQQAWRESSNPVKDNDRPADRLR